MTNSSSSKSCGVGLGLATVMNWQNDDGDDDDDDNNDNDEGNDKNGGNDVDDNHNEENEYGAYRAQMLTPPVPIARQDASKDTTNIFYKEDEAFSWGLELNKWAIVLSL